MVHNNAKEGVRIMADPISTNPQDIEREGARINQLVTLANERGYIYSPSAARLRRSLEQTGSRMDELYGNYQRTGRHNEGLWASVQTTQSDYDKRASEYESEQERLRSRLESRIEAYRRQVASYQGSQSVDDIDRVIDQYRPTYTDFSAPALKNPFIRTQTYAQLPAVDRRDTDFVEHNPEGLLQPEQDPGFRPDESGFQEEDDPFAFDSGSRSLSQDNDPLDDPFDPDVGESEFAIEDDPFEDGGNRYLRSNQEYADPEPNPFDSHPTEAGYVASQTLDEFGNPLYYYYPDRYGDSELDTLDDSYEYNLQRRLDRLGLSGPDDFFDDDSRERRGDLLFEQRESGDTGFRSDVEGARLQGIEAAHFVGGNIRQFNEEGLVSFPRNRDDLDNLDEYTINDPIFGANPADSYVPVYGTVKYWDDLNTSGKALSVGGDILTFVPGIGWVGRGTGRTVRVGVRAAEASTRRVVYPSAAAFLRTKKVPHSEWPPWVRAEERATAGRLVREERFRGFPNEHDQPLRVEGSHVLLSDVPIDVINPPAVRRYLSSEEYHNIKNLPEEVDIPINREAYTIHPGTGNIGREQIRLQYELPGDLAAIRQDIRLHPSGISSFGRVRQELIQRQSGLEAASLRQGYGADPQAQLRRIQAEKDVWIQQLQTGNRFAQTEAFQRLQSLNRQENTIRSQMQFIESRVDFGQEQRQAPNLELDQRIDNLRLEQSRLADFAGIATSREDLSRIQQQQAQVQRQLNDTARLRFEQSSAFREAYTPEGSQRRLDEALINPFSIARLGIPRSGNGRITESGPEPRIDPTTLPRSYRDGEPGVYTPRNRRVRAPRCWQVRPSKGRYLLIIRTGKGERVISTHFTMGEAVAIALGLGVPECIGGDTTQRYTRR